MNRQEFLWQLAQLLEDIPAAERQEALDYYNNYFDDAGPENEAAVIQELGGDPAIAAASIRAEFQSAKTGRKNYGEYTEQGYRDNRIPHDGQMPRPVYGQEKQKKDYWGFFKESFSSSQSVKIAVIILVLILTSGIWLGILGGLFGILCGLLGGILSLAFGVAAFAISLIASGISLIVIAVIKCFTNLPLGLLSVGFGLMMLAAGIVLLVLCLWLSMKYFPKIIRWICRCFSRFCGWCRQKWEQLKN